jgi:ribonucleoside-diphosphate reductase alpha chain
MGFQDALYQLGISFDSPECVDFADRSMEIVSYYAILGSSELARERGSYESFKGSKWDRGIFPLDTIALLEAERGEQIPVSRTAHLDWSVVRQSVKEHGMRNSNCMAIAPTATISNISGCTPAIEPIYKNIYVKSNISGDFTVVNPYLIEDLKRLGLWDIEMLGKIKYHDGSIAEILEIPEVIRARYKETFEIDMKWLIQAAAERGKWIDQSQSLNIFFSGQSGKDLSDIYFLAWNLGLKTTYYLRSMAASQVEKSTVNASEFGSTHTRKGKDVVDGSESKMTPAKVGATAAETAAAFQSSSAVVSAPSLTTQAAAPVVSKVASVQEAPAQATLSHITAPEVAKVAVPVMSAAEPIIAQASADASVKPKYTITKIGDAVCEACE